MVFRSPQYYKELRKYRREKELRERNNSDQSISLSPGDGQVGRSTGPGLQQAIEESVPHNDIEEASSNKPQASSTKLLEERATSVKRQA